MNAQTLKRHAHSVTAGKAPMKSTHIPGYLCGEWIVCAYMCMDEGKSGPGTLLMRPLSRLGKINQGPEIHPWRSRVGGETQHRTDRALTGEPNVLMIVLRFCY